VKVESQGSATENGKTISRHTWDWLVRGVGRVRFEQIEPTDEDPHTLELVATNLAP
jgi:hypothetical protein